MKQKLALVILLVLSLVYFAGSADWTGWEAGRLIYGEHINTTWTFTGYIKPSSQCTTAWVQISNHPLAGYDSNKVLIQNSPTYFANFVKLDTTTYTLAGDSAKILWARYEVAIDTGANSTRQVYHTADSSNYWIGNSDLLPTLYPSGRTNRVYPMYVVGGEFIRFIIKNGVADTTHYTITPKGIRQ